MSNWPEVSLGDVIEYKKGFAFKSENFCNTGVPVVRISDTTRVSVKKDLSAFVSLQEAQQLKQYELLEKDVVLTTVGSRPPLYDSMVGKAISIPSHASGALLNQNMVILRGLAGKLDQDFLAINLRTKRFVYFIETLIRGNANQVSIALKELFKYKFLLPTINEQKEIILILEQWDTAIEKTEALIDAKERQFGWLVTRLINKSGHKKKQLSDFISEVSVRNRGNEIDRVLSVTNRSGFVLPEDQFERRVASANVSNYKIVQQGQYAYNPSRINVGSIARLDDWDNGILSPMYTVFKLDQKIANSDYFLHWLSSSEAKQRIKKSAQGSVRETVSFGDLGAIPICLPELSVQQNIANTLNTAQLEITLLKKLADQYRTQKRGLMQKLLSGEWHIKNKEAA